MCRRCAHPFDQPPLAALLDLVGRADALVIGPGLGREPGRRALVADPGRAPRGPSVLDADALVAFQGAADELRALADERPLVLTPHPGEFRTLFPTLAPVARAGPLGGGGPGGRRDRAQRCCSRACPPSSLAAASHRSRSPPAIPASPPAAAATS